MSWYYKHGIYASNQYQEASGEGHLFHLDHPKNSNKNVGELNKGIKEEALNSLIFYISVKNKVFCRILVKLRSGVF